jgi:hypothetical protein
MALQGTILPSPTDSGPTPTPTMTQWEQAVVEQVRRSRPLGASSLEECEKLFETTTGCDLILTARHITRPEWDELFPWTVFYLVRYDEHVNTYPRHPPSRHNTLVIHDWGDYLSREDFHRLLGGHQVMVTDENRELVARAFVLVSMPDYLEGEIVFSDWEEGSWPSDWAGPYSHRVTVWTKIQGVRMQWYFLFDDKGLLSAKGGIVEYNVGDYIDVPFERLPLERLDLEYWRKQP